MTEQEKREKAIEDMVLDGAECSHIAEWWNCERCKYSPCGARRTCENLVDKGYRKADEVRKEFIDELLQYKQDVDVEYDGLHEVVEVSDIKFIAEKYGVTI